MADPYLDSRDHLWDELARVDQLVKAATVAWRSSIAADKPPHLWGMVHVADPEVQDYLQAPFRPPGEPPGPAEADDYRRSAREVAATIEQRRRETATRVELRLDRLVALFGLSPLERDVLLVCLLPELDGRYRRLFGYLQDDAARTRPSVELALAIVGPGQHDLADARSAFHPGAPLVRHRLLAAGPEAQGEEPLAVRPVRVDDRVVAYVLGGDRVDGRLEGLLAIPAGPLVTLADLVLDPAEQERLLGLVEWLGDRHTARASPTLLLHGPRGAGRRSAARALATALDLPLLLADVPACLRAPDDFDLLAGLAYREALLRGAALCWAGCERLLDPEQPPARWEALLDAAETTGVPTFAVSESPWDPVARFQAGGFLRLDLAMPDFRLRGRLWERYLPPTEDMADPTMDRAATAGILANGFQLTGGQIVDAVAAARSSAGVRDPQDPRVTLDDLYDGCRRQTGHRLISFGHRIEAGTELTFDDLVLPEASRQQLEELRSRIANRSLVLTALGFERRLPLGRGLIAMFTGTSGTGKTMAAELLAREQGVDLFKIDLSTVVSKYVGETEKNLSRVFADAEYANAIIFFDEADALFGKRGEVKEARDRWANIEVNYLLQRVERYAGVLILASNLQQNLDEAFMRRINVIVEFPFPDAAARARIWRGVFPRGLQAPSDTELAELAERFALTGGNIKNIVVDAAFRALAGDGQPPQVQVRHMVASTAREYQKLGKPITKGEFGERFHAWVEQDLLRRRPEGGG
jgi:AAA+ superfamily predicted ATPase